MKATSLVSQFSQLFFLFIRKTVLLTFLCNLCSEGEDDEEVDFAESVLTPSAEWASQNEENMDYQLNFFIALDVSILRNLNYIYKTAFRVRFHGF